jgi:exodeoxyribonuclease III
MKIASWNVNSVRTRLEQVINWLTENPVDVLCLQETKVIDKDFPNLAFENLGYYPYISGQKSYNGVALISRQPLTDVSVGFGAILPEIASAWDEQKRVISGIIEGVRIVNLYVPNGSAIGSDKYEYKLVWLKILKEYLQTLLLSNPTISMCGDFNIALEDIDINKDRYDELENIVINSIISLLNIYYSIEVKENNNLKETFINVVNNNSKSILQSSDLNELEINLDYIKKMDNMLNGYSN